MKRVPPEPPNRPHHERIQDVDFRRAVDLLGDGDVDGLRDHLRRHPDVVSRHVVLEGGWSYFQEPTLLEFVAENPARHDSLPPNIVEVARTILDAGGRNNRRSIDMTLSLVCSGRVSRECEVQVPLIDLLCDYGAEPDGAMRPALAHGDWDAVGALIRRGARVDLIVAAATGRVAAARDALSVADRDQRHLSLALAAQHGHADVVALLLDAGEDPDRYNPPGAHAHSTPLHQAALAGHIEVVRLLVERGARLDIEDAQYHGTPLDWADHAGRSEVSCFLRGVGPERR
jgi:ankyrin repeat protein